MELAICTAQCTPAYDQVLGNLVGTRDGGGEARKVILVLTMRLIIRIEVVEER